MFIKSKLFALLVAVFFSLGAGAQSYVNNVPAVHGYDVVSYHTDKRPAKGNGHFVSEYEGATYLFSNKKNKELFDANPAKYVPAYGGYCAYGVSLGKKFDGDPEVWRVVDGRLYLNLDAGIQDEWFKNVQGHIRSVDKNWKDIATKSPASL